MRTRAGIVLIEDDKVALIERHRAGLDYFVFPGGGVDGDETLEQAAIREAMEELGVEVAIKQEIVVIHFDKSTQVYFLVDRIRGDFGTGKGEEYTDSNPDDPEEGVYVPVWMTMEELAINPKVFPADLAQLVLKSTTQGWASEPITIDERAR